MMLPRFWPDIFKTEARSVGFSNPTTMDISICYAQTYSHGETSGETFGETFQQGLPIVKAFATGRFRQLWGDGE